jgi:ubiquitin carboxyl-terminal hydrolase 22/27/51
MNRFTQPEKLGPKEYSCGKCGKAAHVSLPSLVALLIRVLIRMNIGSKQKTEHPKAANGPELSVQSKIKFLFS